MRKFKMFFNFLILLLAPLAAQAQSDAEIKYYEKLIKENVEKALKYKLPEFSEEFKLQSPDKTPPIDYGTYDFIIIGAGSAGGVLAARLSEVSQWKVLLVEAGGEETDFSDIPAMWAFAANSPLNWGYKTEPQKTCCLGMKNKQCTMPRGKGLGGSSIINTLAYVRGNKRDFDNWAELGNLGWAYADVLPYFKKSENAQFSNQEPGYHGVGGPLNVEYSLPTPATFSNFFEANMELGKEIGDYNGKTQDVISLRQINIRYGKRASIGRVFLDPVRTRSNLNVTIHSLVTKITIVDKTATGVLFQKTNGKLYRANAKKEVILSGGAINSPQLLMLSGIGPKQDLEKFEIPLVADMRQVGENLQDHTTFFGAIFKTNYTVIDNNATNQIKQFLNGLGPLASAGNNAISYLKLPGDDRPQLEIIFLSANTTSALHGSPFNFNDKIQNWFKMIDPMTSIRFHVALMHPKSKGTVKLKSTDPLDFPEIDLNWFSHDDDVEKMVKGVEHVMEMAKTEGFKKINTELIDLPVCGEYRKGTKEFWRCAIKQMSSSIFHPMSTCRMGKSAEDSVVDASGRVHGLKKLRVVDGSIIPATLSAHLNAVIVMMAEKIADGIKKS